MGMSPTDVSTNTPRIETERLLLRWFELGDLAPYYELGTDPELIRYVGNVPYASLDAARETMETAPLRDYAMYGFGRLACVWKETGEVVGFSGPKFLPDLEEVELGYRFLRRFWGKGLATESAKAVIAYARDVLELRRLIALVHPENTASARVLAKVGFFPESKISVSWCPGVELDLYARALDAQPVGS
jgi:RimJ/RimL family protein N-acetyltransferase